MTESYEDPEQIAAVPGQLLFLQICKDKNPQEYKANGYSSMLLMHGTNPMNMKYEKTKLDTERLLHLVLQQFLKKYDFKLLHQS